MAELVKDQAVCGFFVTGKQFFRPVRRMDGSHRDQLNAIRSGLRMMLNIRTDDSCRQPMRKIMNDAVHQPKQRHQ